MTLLPDRTPEHEGHEAAASLLLARIALGLVQHARLHGGFDAEEEALRSRADQLAAELGGNPGAGPGEDPVELELRSGGRIQLSVPFDGGYREHAELREDGFVLGGSTEGPTQTWTRRREEMEPWEQEEERRRDLAREAARGKPKFRGKGYQRTLAAPPQPGADARVLAVELYADGLIVDFTYEGGFAIENPLESWRDPRPPMGVEDDLGTEYYEGERASYGPASPYCYFTFGPAVPAAARVLRITTDSGTVEVATQT